MGFNSFPCVRASKLNQQICISPASRCSSKLTHTQVLKLTPVHSRRVVNCPVQPWASHWSCVFWRNFSNVKRTCWTTGSWRSRLSLEVMSPIPVESTIIYWFICGFIYLSLCQSIKIKPTNICIASAMSQFKINTHRCWNWQLCIPDGLSVVQCSLGHVIGVAFFLRNFSCVKRTCWTTDSWWSCLSLEIVSSISAGPR